MSLKEALTQWAAVRAVVVKSGTRHYHSEILNAILLRWPDPAQLVGTITETELIQFTERVAHFSATRFNGMVTMLSGCVPAARVLRRRQVRPKDRALLNQLQFARLLAECDRLPRSRAGLVVRFLAHTGMRITEAKRLRWADVQEDFILAPGDHAKNGRARVIPFVNGLAEILARLRSLGGEFVLPRARVRRGLEKACARAGVPKLSHHDFRHLFATRCIESGVDLPTVARWLGHSDGGALLARTYFHLADGHSREMAAQVKL